MTHIKYTLINTTVAISEWRKLYWQFGTIEITPEDTLYQRLHCLFHSMQWY